jgi:hypothetical protein
MQFFINILKNTDTKKQGKLKEFFNNTNYVECVPLYLVIFKHGDVNILVSLDVTDSQN